MHNGAGLCYRARWREDDGSYYLFVGEPSMVGKGEREGRRSYCIELRLRHVV